MTYKIDLSIPAREDIKDITDYTQDRYGVRQAESYQSALERALSAISEDPFRPGSRDRSEDANQPGLRSYHTALSNDPSETNVKSPRHLILYSEPKNDVVTIVRVIHETRDIERHLSPERPQQKVYKAKAPEKGRGRER